MHIWKRMHLGTVRSFSLLRRYWKMITYNNKNLSSLLKPVAHIYYKDMLKYSKAYIIAMTLNTYNYVDLKCKYFFKIYMI